MNEQEARDYLSDVSRETMARLECLAALIIAENANQNLISSSTTSHIWARHIIDSAQLAGLTRNRGEWLDLGSGAGFPGLVIAILGGWTVTMVESRPRRAVFLRQAIEAVDVQARATVVADRLERIPPRPFGVISARAFAPLDRLLALAHPFSRPSTDWLLPKGRGATAELAAVRPSWQGDFRSVPSVTDAESAIIVATDVRPRERSK